MDEIKRLTPAQRARCNRLIRRLCANYDGGAASNIKRRESLDFRGFFEGEAGAGQLFDLGIPKILGEPRPAPDALSRFATPLCQVHDKKIWRFFSTSKSQLRTAIPNWLYQYTLSCYVRSFFIFSTISTLLSG